MKKIDKKLLDELIDLHRKRNDRPKYCSVKELRAGTKLCMEKAEELVEKCPEVNLFCLDELMFGIFDRTGFKPDATNEDVYKILEILDYEIVDELEVREDV